MNETAFLMTYSPARALWNQRAVVCDAMPRLRHLIEAVDYATDLAPAQWAQWFSTAMEFRPDLIIELGRGRGNSTALFTEAANRLGDCRVVSLCLDDLWQRESVPRITPQVPADWFAPLDTRIVNILSVDLSAVMAGRKRVLLLWDAHGYAVASYVLGHVLPLLRERAHLVLMHDISDMRYVPANRAYHPNGIWTGANGGEIRLRLGYLDSAVEQVVAISDFCARNDLELHSSDHSFHTELTDVEQETLSQELGEFYRKIGHWFWFTLNEIAADYPMVFPSYTSTFAGPDQSAAAFNAFAALRPTKENIELLQHRIRVMEASPFWKLHVAVKKLLGRS